MVALSHIVWAAWCPMAKPANIASIIIMSMMLFFIVLFILKDVEEND